jgi:threonylcarbamoyladenosine tRNA methylthiotransferase MtaB
MADRKSRQMLHRAKKMNPNAVVVAAGCYVQARGEQADDGIDIVIGNNRKKDLAEILERYFKNQEEKDLQEPKEDQENQQKNPQGQPKASHAQVELLDIAHTHEYEELHLTRQAEHTRANVKVQDGCNQFCSYCIIPYARGRVRSRQKEEVVEEIRQLAANGYKEVVLTGIHLSSYGVDTGDNLLSLIQAVHEIDGILRIRLGSLEPRIITREFAETIAALPKMCPHFHLSLQSGCNETLKRMNRRYTAEEYYEKCELLREVFDRPALTTDVIVGFPGETEEEFEASRAFVEKVNFYETHIFKYSKRQGTKAAEMPDQVPEQVKTARSSVLLELGRRRKKAYEEALIGKTVEVLMEEEITRDGEVWQIGHTREYVKVGQKYEENLTNQLINVEIAQSTQIID